jgi:hypothetical protein
MKNRYQLIRLKTQTVKDLRKLAAQQGTGSLDELIATMIKAMQDSRHDLGISSWGNGLRR